MISAPWYKPCGQSHVGCTLVLDTATGWVATAWMLNEMKSRRMAPPALLLSAANPLMDRFGVDIARVIESGDQVTADPAGGPVVVRRRRPRRRG